MKDSLWFCHSAGGSMFNPFTRIAFACALISATTTIVFGQRQMEALGRGVVAVRMPQGKVWVAWRLLATDPDDTAFNVYRITGSDAPLKLNAEPVKTATNFVDDHVD